MNNYDYENLDDMLDEVDASMTQYNEEKEYEIYVKNCQNEMKNSVKVFGGNTCGQILETMREPLGIIEIKCQALHLRMVSLQQIIIQQ